MRFHTVALAAVLLLPLGAPLEAVAQPMIQSQEGIALENQILQLQQQLQQVQSGGNGGSALGGGSGGNYSPPPAPASQGSAPDASVVTNLLNQVNQLQSQVQELNGKVDTLQNQVNTQNAATEKEIGDLKFQMTNGASGSGPGTGPGTPQNAPPEQNQGQNQNQNQSQNQGAPPAAAPASPKVGLRDAQAALTRHDYAVAEQNARAVLAASKASPEGYQAQYVLAQALYGEGKPQDAAIAYDVAYNRAHAGPNAPGALLGLANSLAAIHQNAAACDTLASLNSQFPAPPKGMGPAIVAASHRAHCQ